MKTRSKIGALESGLTNHYYTNKPISDGRTRNLLPGLEEVLHLQAANPKEQDIVAHDRGAYLLGHDVLTFREPRRPWWFLLPAQQDYIWFETQLLHPLTKVTHWIRKENDNCFTTWHPRTTFELITECLNVITGLLLSPFDRWAPVDETDTRHPKQRSGMQCWPLLYPTLEKAGRNQPWSSSPCMVYSKDKVKASAYTCILRGYLYICLGKQCRSRKGRKTTRGVYISAHRLLAWAMYGKPPHQDQVVIHTCENKRCLHPAHLKYASQQQNLRLAKVGKNKRPRYDDWNAERQMILDGLSDELCDYVHDFPLCDHSFRIVPQT